MTILTELASAPKPPTTPPYNDYNAKLEKWKLSIYNQLVALPDLSFKTPEQIREILSHCVKGDSVQKNGIIYYLAVCPEPPAVLEDVNDTYWSDIAHLSDFYVLDTSPLYDYTKAYKIGNFVKEQGAIYKALKAGTNLSLQDAEAWEVVGSYVNPVIAVKDLPYYKNGANYNLATFVKFGDFIYEKIKNITMKPSIIESNDAWRKVGQYRMNLSNFADIQQYSDTQEYVFDDMVKLPHNNIDYYYRDIYETNPKKGISPHSAKANSVWRQMDAIPMNWSYGYSFFYPYIFVKHKGNIYMRTSEGHMYNLEEPGSVNNSIIWELVAAVAETTIQVPNSIGSLLTEIVQNPLVEIKEIDYSKTNMNSTVVPAIGDPSLDLSPVSFGDGWNPVDIYNWKFPDLSSINSIIEDKTFALRGLAALTILALYMRSSL